MRFAVPALAFAALMGLTGCGGGSEPDTERGRLLFGQNCSGCHALADFGSSEGTGPNLDSAFAQARADGMDSDTIEGVTLKQIAHPRTPNVPEGTEEYIRTYMPPDIVTGQDAEDVAAYVGLVAGVPGAKPPPLGAPEEIFASKCASCHTLEPGAPAGTGPNLADSLQGKSAGYIRKQIVDPDSNIVSGFQPGVMPGDFEQQLGDKVDGLVQYILSEVQGGGA